MPALVSVMPRPGRRPVPLQLPDVRVISSEPVAEVAPFSKRRSTAMIGAIGAISALRTCMATVESVVAAVSTPFSTRRSMVALMLAIVYVPLFAPAPDTTIVLPTLKALKEPVPSVIVSPSVPSGA